MPSIALYKLGGRRLWQAVCLYAQHFEVMIRRHFEMTS